MIARLLTLSQPLARSRADEPAPRGLRGWTALLALWTAILIVTPIVGWIGGADTFPAAATLGVLAQVALTLRSLALSWPLRRLVRAAGLVMIGAWIAEGIGVQTGIPFGDYVYTDALQPQAAGVPLLIPAAWLMMLPPAWAAADALLPYHSHPARRLGFAMLSGAAFTAWDLYLDPQMVAHGLWTWQQPGGYFGVPWVNLLGWWIVSSALTLLIACPSLPRRPLLAIYTLTWAFQAVGLGIFWGQPGPALAGFAGMGVFVAAAWWKESRRWQSSPGQ